MTSLDGKALGLRTKEELKSMSLTLKARGVEPCLAVTLVGDDTVSQGHVNVKTKACEVREIKPLAYKLDPNTTRSELLALINTLNYDDSMHDILIQLLLSPHISKNLILENILSSEDVDGFHLISVGYLNLGVGSGFLPCAPLGVIKLLKACGMDLESLDTAIIDASNIVDCPMVTMLLNAGVSIGICHIKTKDLSFYTEKVDLIIVAAGCVNLLREDIVRKGVIVVDVGVNRIDNRLVGNVDFDKASKRASFISPVSGSVGPMTVAMLFENVIKSAKNRLSDPQI